MPSWTLVLYENAVRSVHLSQSLYLLMNIFRYLAKTRCNFSREPLVCGWKAVVQYCWILNVRATAFIKALVKFAAWSVRMALEAPKWQMNRLMNESAILIDVDWPRSIHTKYFVNRFCMVGMYVLSALVVCRGSTMSRVILWRTRPDASVRIIGCLVLTWTSFFLWQSAQFRT